MIPYANPRKRPSLKTDKTKTHRKRRILLLGFINILGFKAIQHSAHGQGSQVCQGKAEVVNGMVICTVTKEVDKQEKNCSTPPTPEPVFIYYSNPSIIKEALTSTGMPACAKILKSSDTSSLSKLDAEPKFILIYGDENGRTLLKRNITALDLPKERINLDLWAIDISSTSSAKLADVMGEVRRQINDTQSAMRETYREFSRLSQANTIDPEKGKFIESHNFGTLVRDTTKTPMENISMTEMLIRINLTYNRERHDNPSAFAICSWFAEKKKNDPRFKFFNEFEGRSLKAYNVKRFSTGDPPRAYRRPFQSFMEVALHQNFDRASGQPKCGDGSFDLSNDSELQKVTENAKAREDAIFRFASAYNQFRLQPSNYDEQELSQSAASLDSLLYDVVDAINRDIEDYFITPTLHRIRQIVSRERGVDYAEVGRTTISSLNGLESKATSTISTSIDQPTPLRLNQLLKDASAASKDVETVLPGLSQVPLGAGSGAITAGSALALASALSKEEVRWSALHSGLEMNITPTVFRDRSGAELKVNLNVGNPAEETKSKDNPLRPLSRISQSTLDTKVYVKTMDLFALSSFNNQTTLSGGRSYIPLVGTIWEGAFGDIPIVGGLFSFKRPTQNVQHQNIILTNTLIVPSAMGMGSYWKRNSPPFYIPILEIPTGEQHSNSVPRSERIFPTGQF